MIRASCEPGRALSLGRCSNVIAVLFSILDHVKKHRPILSKPCTSQECSWNKGKKRNNNPRQVSNAKYQNKRKQSAAHVIDFEPRPLEYCGVSLQQINPLVSALNDVSRYSDCLSMWEMQLKFTYKNYDLSRPSCLKEKVIILYNDLTPATVMEIPGTQGQSACEKWFVQRWCRLTAYKCLPAYKVGKLF